MAIKYLSSAKIQNKSVLVRGSVDVNIDSETGKVDDDFRLRAFLPTINFLLKNNNKIIICGKRKRAKGKIVPEFSLKPAAKCLADVLGYKFIPTNFKIPRHKAASLIFYSGDLTESRHQKQIRSIPVGDVVFLENLEFYKEELDNDLAFAKKLDGLADCYVDDDFSKCHHPVASNVGVTKYLASYAGLLLENEIKSLDIVIKHAKKPFVVMTGGIKLTEKVGALENLGKKADKILVGGGVANLMFLSKGLEIGKSKIEEGETKTAWQILKNYKDKLVLPLDLVVADEKMSPGSVRVRAPYEVKKDEQILDAGPKTILEFAKEIKKANTILWSGPLGLFERSPFHHATIALARLLGGRGKGRAFVVAGGGDTVSAIAQAHQMENIDHISTGGGAMLEYLAGEKLPGIEALK